MQSHVKACRVRTPVAEPNAKTKAWASCRHRLVTSSVTMSHRDRAEAHSLEDANLRARSLICEAPDGVHLGAPEAEPKVQAQAS